MRITPDIRIDLLLTNDILISVFHCTYYVLCFRSYHGHVNEKNFVGLATDGDFFTCGSENNSLYVYYKGLSKPLFSFKFDMVRTLFERDAAGNR